VWVLLTWTLTAEVLLTGAVVAGGVAVALAPFGDVVPPWRLAAPRRAYGLGRLAVDSLRRVVVANARLTRMVWSRTIPLRSGMVVVGTAETTEGGLAAVGLISSLVVDNQIVDVDRPRHRLQYHAVVVPDGDRKAAYDAINGPIERRLAPVEGRDR
jgi:multicomponent Na+:H+ antiporter subunit E